MKRIRSPSSTDNKEEVDYKPPTHRHIKHEVEENNTNTITTTTHSSQQGHVPDDLQDLYMVAMGTSTSSDRFPTYPFMVAPSTIDAALESLQRFEKRGTAQAEEVPPKPEVKTEQNSSPNKSNASVGGQSQRRYLFTHGLPRAQFVIEDDQLREEIAAVTGEFMRRRFLQLYNEVTDTSQ